MKTIRSSALLAFAMLVSCSTSHRVSVNDAYRGRNIRAIAQTPEEDNSAEMDGHLAAALQQNGVTLRPKLQSGVRTAGGVDAVVGYVDVWRWDVTMYLSRLTVNFYDPKSGDLMATGYWSDSPLHGYRDPAKAMDEVVDQALTEIRGRR